ncbi:AraC family transcriptional regulator [Pontibacter sp. SGAir0037]|uniref:AraC family transcriptional regulator n=1 Tax=Pontibacter sp. SGAir0037 TaxID=2571030 RepID=UPI0010CCD34D|nr:AraC family transcriptional regulator [Pontibacter sp. SGAir0037]QCR22297.1 AraC family transcriptional regulator [Pontibacter sp. SGAir0037]
MKPIYFQIPKSTGETVRVQYDKQEHFYDNLHFHPEVQIMLITEGSGTRFIGDSIGSFGKGDILLLGPNLPHVFRNDKKYYEHDPLLKASNISVFFQIESFGEAFLSLPEVYPIQRLLLNSKRGIVIKGHTKEKVSRLVHQMVELDGFELFISLFSILNLLALSREVELLSSVGFDGPQKDADSKKINDVFTYIMNNFSEEIKLQKAADIANMSVNAFCRYFKQHTRKTFSEFLNEIRIGHACRLLIEDRWNVRETAFECGYDNISYFNRQFKDITGFTPSEYIKLHKEKFPLQLS